MGWATGATFYFGVPAALALLIGWNVAQPDTEAGRIAAMLFWLGLSLMAWWAGVIGTRITHWLGKPWRPSLWLLCPIGAMLGALLFYVPIVAYLEITRPLIGGSFEPPGTPGLRADFLLGLLTDIVPGILLWTGVNYVYDRYLGIPRLRYFDEAQPSGIDMDRQQPPFLAKLQRHRGDKLIALAAEDHYVRVYTDDGDELIHYRFAKAVAEAAALDGLQTHRSHWVAGPAIRDLVQDKHNFFIVLRNGQRVPVSRTYLRDARRAVKRSGAPDGDSITTEHQESVG